MEHLSSGKLKKVTEWAERARRLRVEQPGRLSQEEWAHFLGVSTSDVRRWEQGTRMVPVARCIQLGNLAEPPDCWYWWELAGLDKARLLYAVTGSSPQRKRRSGRFADERVYSAHLALDLLFERATSAQIERVLEKLDDFAVKYGTLPEGPDDPPRPRK